MAGGGGGWVAARTSWVEDMAFVAGVVVVVAVVRGGRVLVLVVAHGALFGGVRTVVLLVLVESGGVGVAVAVWSHKG